MKVFVGNTSYEKGQRFDINVFDDVINHEDYDPETMQNDISLIRTPQDISFDSTLFYIYDVCYKKFWVSVNVGLIQLPLITLSHSEQEYIGQQVLAFGWGYSSFGNNFALTFYFLIR